MAISKMKNRIGGGVLFGTVCGFFAGTIIAKAILLERNFGEWMETQIDAEEKGFNIGNKVWPYVGINIACGAAIGALVKLKSERARLCITGNKPIPMCFPDIPASPGTMAA